MSTTPTTETRRKSTAKAPRRLWPRVLIIISLGIIFLSAVRVVTGADDISSSGALNASLALAVPIGLAGLGGLWSERAGVVNIGLEGMMILGTWGAGFFGWQWGPWAGVLGGVALGALGGLLHAFTTVTFGVDHIVSGVAINILALGATQYLAAVAFSGKPGGGETRSPSIDDMPSLSVPGIGDPLGDLEAKNWFLISDLAAFARSLTVNVNALTIIAVALFVLTWFVLWRTVFGLRLRSCGESPSAAESLGVNVYRYKYYAVITSGALAGLGGAFLAIVASSSYRDGQTGGRGYIGLAAMIFGNWRPGGLGAGAGLFGYTNALQLRRGGESVHALLLVVAVLVIALAAWQLRSGFSRSVAVAGSIGVLVLTWYLLTDEVPEDFTRMTPYIATLLVLALASQRLRMPAADGQIYRRGQAG
ncbi:MAG TPA: ABC transporter permease [Actinomycetes bacterium]